MAVRLNVGGLASVVLAVEPQGVFRLLRGASERHWRMEFSEVTCPTCGEAFEVAVPPADELPAELDYDCEVCCRPMVIVFTGEEVYAKGLAE